MRSWSLLLVPLLGIAQQPTHAPSGPYHVSGQQILDRHGHPYLFRGTSLAPITLEPLAPTDLGATSASALVTIRQRLNMNAVRVPFFAADYQRDPTYRRRVAEVIRTANLFELVTILDPQPSAPASFWSTLATDFRDSPSVSFFIDADAPAALAIRSAGATQPIISTTAIADTNSIYQQPAHFTDPPPPPADRPLLVDGLDPGLDQPTPECSAFPADPTAATSAIESRLRYFDLHSISWIISAFRPGRLITDTRYYTGTKLDDGWNCAPPIGMVGLGIVLLSHLWQADPHGLFIVNGDAGSFHIPRGGRATIYGPILADREIISLTPRITLGNIKVRITDSQGVMRFAPLLYTGAGWSQLNLVVPDDTAPGPALFTILRADGSSVTGHSQIDDVAPGLHSATADGRGPAKAQVTQQIDGGKIRTSPTFECSAGHCRTLPVALVRGAPATLRLEGTGFRHASSRADFQLTIGGISVPVVDYGPAPGNPGSDFLTATLPPTLIGCGETDLFLSVAGRLSNVVRINFAPANTTTPSVTAR